jgi:hypothetical protein
MQCAGGQQVGASGRGDCECKGEGLEVGAGMGVVC